MDGLVPTFIGRPKANVNPMTNIYLFGRWVNVCFIQLELGLNLFLIQFCLE